MSDQKPVIEDRSMRELIEQAAKTAPVSLRDTEQQRDFESGCTLCLAHAKQSAAGPVS